MCIFCEGCVFFWELCCLCVTFSVVRVFFCACVLRCVCAFRGLYRSGFFDMFLCARVCMRGCLCAVRCVSLNSLRERKRTLRTRRSSHHGIPSLMSYRDKQTKKQLALTAASTTTLHIKHPCCIFGVPNALCCFIYSWSFLGKQSVVYGNIFSPISWVLIFLIYFA